MTAGLRYRVILRTAEGRILTVTGTFLRYEQDRRNLDMMGRRDQAVFRDDAGRELSIPKGITDQVWARRTFG